MPDEVDKLAAEELDRWRDARTREHKIAVSLYLAQEELRNIMRELGITPEQLEAHMRRLQEEQNAHR